MIPIVILVVLVAWPFFISTLSFIEGFLWHFKVLAIDKLETKKEKTDLHPTLVSLRAIFFATLILAKVTVKAFSAIYIYAVFFAGLFLIYPFFHLGVLYYVRNGLNPNVYKKGFKANFVSTDKKNESKTDRLKILDTYKQRLIWFWIGAALIVASLVLELV